jgi:ATP-dependent Lon protease
MSISDLDSLIRDNFCDVCIDKRLSRKVAGTSQAIPDYVSDWLVSRYTTDGSVDESKISAFLAKHLPDKKHKNILLDELRKGQSLKILDAYTARVDIANNKLKLDIPSLDISGASVRDTIIDEHPLLLMGNVWGSGTLVSQLVDQKSDKYEVAMVDFKPMQTSKVDLDFYINTRKNFTLRQWRELLVRSMGYNPNVYSQTEQMHLLTRLAPLIQQSINIIELAPKGTGKSYVYSRLSRHAWLISGGVVTRAQLFYNMGSKTAGVITRFDAVVLDEIQTIKFSDEGELVGAMKGYLEQGEFRVMQYKGSSDAGFVLLANIPLNEDSTPKEIDLFRGLPSWLHGQTSTALIDRFHGIIPGWEIRKINKDCLCDGMALKADYFGEIFHALRARTEYMQWVKDNTRSNGNLRDINAVERLAAAFLKLLFPDLTTVSPELFRENCLNPAKSLRKRIRKQLAISDPEYSQELAEIEVHI